MIFSSIKYWFFSTILLGFVYPLVMTGVGQICFHDKANGQLAKDSSGSVRGSFLLAQKFESTKYFWPRPSGSDYNAAASAATNLSLTHKDLRAAMDARRKIGAVAEGLFASGSGLDPEVSPENAFSQVDRIAKERSLKSEKLHELVAQNIEERDWGFLGERRVNVMKLNLSLDRMVQR